MVSRAREGTKMLSIPRDARTRLLEQPIFCEGFVAELWFEQVDSIRLARSGRVVLGVPVVGFRIDGGRLGHHERGNMGMSKAPESGNRGCLRCNRPRLDDRQTGLGCLAAVRCGSE
jgi:hypothetical protein